MDAFWDLTFFVPNLIWYLLLLSLTRILNNKAKKAVQVLRRAGDQLPREKDLQGGVWNHGHLPR